MAKHNIFSLVSDFFRGDNKKTFAWFTQVHSHFGKRPIDMMRKGQHDKLLKYVLTQLDEGKL
jgi:hypothetical protein